jgi:hypothetical protein
MVDNCLFLRREVENPFEEGLHAQLRRAFPLATVVQIGPELHGREFKVDGENFTRSRQ